MLQLILVYSPRPVCLLPFLGANIFSYGFSSRTAECSLVFFPMDGNVQVGDSAATLLLDADGNFRFHSVLTSPILSAVISLPPWNISIGFNNCPVAEIATKRVTQNGACCSPFMIWKDRLFESLLQ